jgi:hypothetical protein
MYLANQTMTLKLNDSGNTLTILEGTIFSLDGSRNPVLLKGQITADFISPVTIYAIKFDRYDLELFQNKLNQFWRIRTLPENEYFVIKNIHTKFRLTNQPNQFGVAVENGQVNVLADKTEKTIDAGKQISIDAKNTIKESIYITSKIYSIIFSVCILIAGIVLLIYRKTKVGGRIISTLKNTGIFCWKRIWLFFQFLVKSVKKIDKTKK